MNKFQAMAHIMAILCEDGSFPKGSRRYKLARKFIATKIDTMGPDTAYNQAKWAKYHLLIEIEELLKAEKTNKIIFNFISFGPEFERLLSEMFGLLSIGKSFRLKQE